MDLLAPVLWFLLLILAAGHAEATLSQTGSVSVSLGGTAQLSCTLSGDSIATYTILWFQHQLPKPPKYILYYKDESAQGRQAGVPERFSASKNIAGHTCSLIISAVQAGDESDYYCMTSKGGEYIFGSGTQLSITGLDPAPPKLNVYPPSPEEIKTTNKATLVCLVQDFNPGAIQVDWLADGTKITQNVETSRPKKQGDKYISSSYLTLNRADWERQNCYKCRVTHEGKRYEEPVNPSQCSSP